VNPGCINAFSIWLNFARIAKGNPVKLSHNLGLDALIPKAGHPVKV
jgi:hypothetical protein